MTELAVVVGYDCITSLGVDVATSWDAAVHGKSGVRPIDRYAIESTGYRGVEKIHCAGQLPMSLEQLAGSREALVKWPEPGYHAARLLARRLMGRFGSSLAEADRQRIGVFGATALTSQASHGAVAAEKRATAYFILNQCHNTPLSAVAIEHKLQGPSYSINSACASSNHALYTAALFIAQGIIDAALVVAFEFPVLPICTAGFAWMNALYSWTDPRDRGYSDPAACSRPLSSDRRGFVLAEGAGVVMLASRQLASRHDWPVEASIAGGCMNGDALHMTNSSKQQIAACIRGALQAAQCAPEQVGCINAHATSTGVGDGAETIALADVFGAVLPEIPVVANKSQLGHSLGASGVLGLILAIEGMKRGVLLPTLNYRPDPALPGIRATAEPRPLVHRTVLLNSFGFGGTNACLVVSRL